jgi:sugar/nucleoside kinase (ribokinase family)
MCATAFSAKPGKGNGIPAEARLDVARAVEKAAKRPHPRLFADADGFAALKARLGKEELLTAGAEFVRATALLREKSAHVIISDGGAGAWFDGAFVAAPKVDVVDTTAAGDTLLAEWCWRCFGECGMRNAEWGKWAVAAGSAACTMPGGAPPSSGVVEALKKFATFTNEL